MAIDFLQEIIRYLNIDCNKVANYCQYPTPLEGLFYLVFFPSVVLIIFIYILSDVAMKKVTGGGEPHRGIKLLLAIAVLIYIIMQGWFTWFVNLTNAWFIVTIIFLGVLVFIGRFIGGEEEGGEGRRGGLSAIATYPVRRMKKEVTGDVRETKKEIEAKLSQMDGLVEELKETSKRGDSQGFGMVFNRYMTMEDAVRALIRELEADIGTGFARVDRMGEIGKYKKELEKMSERVKKIHKP